MIPPRKNPKAKVSPPPVNSTPAPSPVSKSSIAVNPENIQKEIKRLLKFSTFEPEHRYWLDTGSPILNKALGTEGLGLPFGKLYELSGLPSGGKTTLSMVICGLAQKDGAGAGIIDVENSRDRLWSIKLGADFDSLIPIYPKLILPKKKEEEEPSKPPKPGTKPKKPRPIIPYLQSAEDLFEEAEMGMYLLSQKGFEKQFWIVDSIAMLQTSKVVEAGADQNMRTRLDRAMFLSEILPRWAGLAANYNAMVFFINQLRMKQGMVFGDPLYEPGGKALDHALSVRARITRGKKGGRLLKNGQPVGISGIIKNKKNKAGSGSVEQARCGFKIRWDVSPAKIQFVPPEEVDPKEE